MIERARARERDREREKERERQRYGVTRKEAVRHRSDDSFPWLPVSTHWSGDRRPPQC